MDVTFLFLFAGALAVIGWLSAQLVFFLLARKRERLQQRLASGNRTGFSTYRPIVLPKEEDSLRTLLDQKRLLRSFTHKLSQAYPGVTFARFLLIEAMVVLGCFASVGLVTQSFLLGVLVAAFATMLPVAVVNAKRAR